MTAPGPNADLAADLAEIAALLRLQGADRFRIRAYDRLSRTVAAMPVPLATLPQDSVARLRGVGPGLGRLVAERLGTGRIRMLDELRAPHPPGFGQLIRVRGVSPTVARRLYAELGVDSVATLEAALEAGRLGDLGTATEERIGTGLRLLRYREDPRMLLVEALQSAQELRAWLAAQPTVAAVEIAGALRRGMEQVDRVELVAAADDGDTVIDAFSASALAVAVLGRRTSAATILTARGRAADLRVTHPDTFGTALVEATGAPAHVNRLGPTGAHRTEKEVYGRLGLGWVPPPLREGIGEVEAAAAGHLPQLVDVTDLRGDLHGHSDWSGDGKATLQRMVEAAERRGYSYWAVTDHAENLAINGLSRQRMLDRRQLIGQLRECHEIAILDGAELNIGPGGDLDYDLEFLLAFDFCVASVHSLMRLSAAEQTERILRAVRHPAVHVIGHPTGRILGHRPGYEIDLAAIAEAAAETGTALEVNASPRRLDLSGTMVRVAVAAGATIAVSSDAHTVAELGNIRYGVLTAQRGWATPSQVLNCRDLERLRAFVLAKRGQ